jgi:phage replication O-like protein O
MAFSQGAARMDPNPQAEDGHVDVANEIVEALCRIQLSGYESRVLWALFRKTYGWHKKEDRISLTQFQVLTGLPIPKISNTLNRLALRKMVRVTENGNGKIKTYGFQKVFSLWQDLPEKVIPKSAIPEKGITENGSQGLPILASTKETITKEKESIITIEPEEVELSPTDQVMLAYNKFCPSLQRILDMGTSTRWMAAQHIFAKYKSHEGGPQRFLDCLFKKAEASDRLTNRDGQWKGPPCSIDWLLKEDNYLQVIEGKYDNGNCKPAHQPKRKQGFQGVSDDLKKAFS